MKRIKLVVVYKARGARVNSVLHVKHKPTCSFKRYMYMSMTSVYTVEVPGVHTMARVSRKLPCNTTQIPPSPVQ